MIKVTVQTPPVVVVPRLWPNGTVACLATGPSLTQADVDAVRGKADGVIAINDAFRLAPWADVLYACDGKWWGWHSKKGAADFAGLKYALTSHARLYPGVQVLKNSGETGLSLDPTALKNGKNSGYQAINLAVLMGATTIILLGYDMQGQHFFGKHPDGSVPPFAMCQERFRTIVEPLKEAGVDVLNCSRSTALQVFPKVALEAALERAA